MTLREQIVLVTRRYCAVTGMSQARLSTIILGGGHRLATIANGRGDLNTGTFEKAMAWLSLNWPADADWPDGVDRPQSEAAE